MRYFSVLILTGLLSSFALILMPWWIPMIVGFFIVLVLPMKLKQSFLAPALGCALAFIFIALWKDLANNHLLSAKIAQIFHLPSYLLLVLITGLIGFITAGLGGLIAFYLVAFSRSLLYSESEEAETSDKEEDPQAKPIESK